MEARKNIQHDTTSTLESTLGSTLESTFDDRPWSHIREGNLRGLAEDLSEPGSRRCSSHKKQRSWHS